MWAAPWSAAQRARAASTCLAAPLPRAGESLVEAGRAGPWADLEPGMRAVTGVELLDESDPARQVHRYGIAVGQHRTCPPGAAVRMAQPPPVKAIDDDGGKGMGRPLLQS